jgi:cytidine deaminase
VLELDELVARASAVRERAHAPYSGFRVGAVIEASDGRTAVGCNVENASFGLGVCAERAAVSAALAAGLSEWKRLVVLVEAPQPVAPCGACRQVLAEFCDELEVVLVTTSGLRDVTSLSELLPRRFGAGDLGEGRDAD